MANKVCSAAEEGPNALLVRQQLDDLPDNIRVSWQAFKEAKLNRINEQNKVGRARLLATADAAVQCWSAAPTDAAGRWGSTQRAAGQSLLLLLLQLVAAGFTDFVLLQCTLDGKLMK